MASSKWKHFPHYWPFVQGIHWSPVNSPLKGQWLEALMFPFICTWTNGWVNNQDAGDLRRHHAHHDITTMHCKMDAGRVVQGNNNTILSHIKEIYHPVIRFSHEADTKNQWNLNQMPIYVGSVTSYGYDFSGFPWSFYHHIIIIEFPFNSI